MALTQLIVLAVLQGITEFLPISSSGHLILVPLLTGWQDQGLVIDVAVHVGTLAAVMIYFAQDIWLMLRGLVRAAQGKRDAGARLALQVAAATIPVLAAGYLVDRYVGDGLRAVAVIGWATLGFGILLLIADKMCMTVKRIEHLSYLDAVIIGFAQSLALVPGTSRSGITMTFARFLGYERPDAARLSMLMSIPTIAASGIWIGLKLYQAHDVALTRDAVLAAGISFATAILAIAALMAWLQRASFTPFVVYRVLLGLALLALAYNFI